MICWKFSIPHLNKITFLARLKFTEPILDGIYRPFSFSSEKNLKAIAMVDILYKRNRSQTYLPDQLTIFNSMDGLCVFPRNILLLYFLSRSQQAYSWSPPLPWVMSSIRNLRLLPLKPSETMLLFSLFTERPWSPSVGKNNIRFRHNWRSRSSSWWSGRVTGRLSVLWYETFHRLERKCS